MVEAAAMFGLLIVFTPVFIIIAWYVYYYRCMKPLAMIDGPSPFPLLGHSLDFKDTESILPTCNRYFAKYGKIVKIMLGVVPVIIVADYKGVENVLASNKLLKKSPLYRFFYKWLNLGLLTSDGKKWKQRRRILTPSYHFQILEQFIPIFNKIGDILVEEFRKEKVKSCVDVYPYVTLSTLDVICETAMGVAVNAQINKKSAYVQSVKTMTRLITDRIFSPRYHYDILYQFTDNYKQEQECLKILHGHTKAVIESRRKELEKKKKYPANVEDDFGSKKRVAFLDILLQSTDENGAPLSVKAIQEEVDTFMFEGHDTTSSAISFALFEIANNPVVQKKILDEQNEIFGKENREITSADLNQMKYLELVIKETLRIHPSVPFFGRTTTEDFKLTDDITIPAGYSILVLAINLQKDEEFYPNPGTFDPERFLPERNMGKPFSFIPFSAGPRNCIGQKFAVLEIKCTLSKIVRNFELKPTIPKHQIKFASEAILKSNNGILIQIHERN